MFYNSIIAGIMIAIGAMANLAVGGGPLGAVIFSVGLISIVSLQLNLFTGKAGLLATSELRIPHILAIWYGNAIGTCVAGLLTLGKYSSLAQKIFEAKLPQGYLMNFFAAILCGVLMYAAVSGYKETRSFVPVVFCVAAFIICGFNHCVADMAYLALMQTGATWSHFALLLVDTLGNVIGCNLIPIGKRLAF